jgi:hypothetical protein
MEGAHSGMAESETFTISPWNGVRMLQLALLYGNVTLGYRAEVC